MAWLPGYGYRQPLVITGGASGAQADFQLNIDIAHVAAKMQAAFGDIRFTQNDGTTLIDAWLESKVDGTSADVWAEFPTTPANTVEQTYYMYYGNAGAASDWNGAATFPLFDDFLGSSVDTGKWTVVGSPTVSAGILTVSGGSSSIKSISNFANTYALRTRVTNQTAAANRSAMFSWFGSAKYDYAIYGNHPTANVLNGLITGEGSSFSLGHDGATTYLYELQRSGTQCVVYEYQTGSPVHKGTLTGGVSCDAHVYYGGDGASNPIISVDWTLVRKYASGPPTYTFGSEESAPTGAAPTSIFIGPFGGPFGGPIQ